MESINYEWVIGILIPTSVAYGYYMMNLMQKVESEVKEMLVMHKHPDDYGFGTQSLKEIMGRQNSLLREQRDVMREMVQLIRFEAEARTGRKPPPFVRLHGGGEDA